MKNNKMISGLMVLSLVVAGFLFSGANVNATKPMSYKEWLAKQNAKQNACARTRAKNSYSQNGQYNNNVPASVYLQQKFGPATGYVVCK